MQAVLTTCVSVIGEVNRTSARLGGLGQGEDWCTGSCSGGGGVIECVYNVPAVVPATGQDLVYPPTFLPRPVLSVRAVRTASAEFGPASYVATNRRGRSSPTTENLTPSVSSRRRHERTLCSKSFIYFFFFRFSIHLTPYRWVCNNICTHALQYYSSTARCTGCFFFFFSDTEPWLRFVLIISKNRIFFFCRTKAFFNLLSRL